MRRVYIETFEDRFEAAVVDDGVIQHFYSLKRSQAVGNIYLGKVLNVNKNIGVFVDIGEERPGLLPYRENLHSGDVAVVQVTRDAVGEKGCQLSEEISFAGRFVVVNGKGTSGCSRHLSEERKKAGLSLIPVLCASGNDINFGITLRTAYETAAPYDVESETQGLKRRYIEVKEKARNKYNVCLLYRAEPLETAKNYAESDGHIIYGFDGIRGQVDGIFSREVTVNGIRLVFDKTEAMTVIDVNIGNFPLKFKDAETANTEADLIAAEEIARQIRVRNIGGNILVDFITVKSAENKQKVISAFKKELQKDNVKCFVDNIDSLFIVSVNRLIRY